MANISQIKLPNGSTYDIYDASALHNIDVVQALVFKGSQTNEAAIKALTNVKMGAVYHATLEGTEWLCVKEVGSTADATAWEELGNPLVDNHYHKLTGTITVSGGGESMSSSGTITPSLNRTDIKVKATASGGNVTKNTGVTAITALGTPTTDAALGTGATFKTSGGDASTQKLAVTTVKNPSATDVSVPVISSNGEVEASKVSNAGSVTPGQAASWGASVANGVLSFTWAADTPTAVTLPTFDTVKATKTVLGTAKTASKVTTSNVTVATGGLTTSGTGADVVTGVSAVSVSVDSADQVNAVTGYPSPSTDTAIKTVTVTQPTITLTADTNGFKTGETVSGKSQNVSVSGTVPSWTKTVSLSNNSTGAPKGIEN